MSDDSVEIRRHRNPDSPRAGWRVRRISIGAALVMVALAACTSALSQSGGEKSMAQPKLSATLKGMSLEDDAGFQALARKIAADCDTQAHELVELAHAQPEAEAQKASAVLMALESHAFPALLAGVHAEDPKDYVWDAQTLTDILAESRRRLIALLDKMLDDKRDHPMPDLGPKVEEKFRPRRVCDEAYLLERTLLYPNESEDDRYMNARMFLKLSVADRDHEIFHARRTRKFGNFMNAE